jgi:hypothetical protein
MINTNHIILKNFIEINFRDLEEAMGVQNRVAEVFYEKLQPRMEALFDEMVGDKYLSSIEYLEIDCEIISHTNWEEEWVETTLRKLREQLRTIHKKSLGKDELHELAKESFIFFLEHGYFPWNHRLNSIIELEQSLSIDASLMTKLKEAFGKSDIVAERLSYQFSENFRNRLITTFLEDNRQKLQLIVSFYETLLPLEIDRRPIDSAMFKSILNHSEDAGSIQHFFSLVHTEVEEVRPVIQEMVEKMHELTKKNALLATKAGKEKKEAQKIRERKIIKENAEAIYINNAGLVIVHPFLPQFFEELLLIKEQEWVDDYSKHRATLILNFLATGVDEFFEFNLPLHKILCGIEIDVVAKAEQPIAETVKSECDDLLLEVIRHWSVLKNTAIVTFRETFLQRNGKLSRTDNGWLLQVEQKAVDVLLGSLPWGIGIIKLPWMKGLLYVEWC